MTMEGGGGGGGGGCERDIPVSVTTSSSSPEFEFWMVRNPSFPQTQLLSADELFVDGVLLPLHLIHSHSLLEPKSDKCHDDPPESTSPEQPQPAVFSADSALVSSSKRWKGIFRGAGGEKKAVMMGEEKFRRRKWKNGGGGSAELNINIWPFSRSRSAGDKAVGMGFSVKAAVAGRKVGSAPCSRSNSRGESSKVVGGLKSTGTMSSRGGGVHVGRTNPIWKIRKSGKKSQTPPQTAMKEEERKDLGEIENGDNGGGKKVNDNKGVRIETLKSNVKTRLGKRHQMKTTRCSGEDKKLLLNGEQINDGGGVSSHFNLKAFFSKKVH